MESLIKPVRSKKGKYYFTDMPSKSELKTFINRHLETSSTKVKRIIHYSKTGALIEVSINPKNLLFSQSFMKIVEVNPMQMTAICDISNNLHGYGSILNEIAYFNAYPRKS